MKRFIPNLLTLSRIPLGVLIAILIYEGYFFVATFLYFVAELTDYFDGKLARSWEVTSDFGKKMDLLSDKFLILLVLFSLQDASIVPSIMFHIVFSREILTSTLRVVAEKQSCPTFLQTSAWGRYTSVILREAIGCLIMLAGFKSFHISVQQWHIIWNVSLALAWVGVVTRIFFFLHYLWRDRNQAVLLVEKLLGTNSFSRPNKI